jgi:formylglycine-generating enzyme required for sulfatase activity
MGFIGLRAMGGKIFINYRRGDDPGSAQALFARLEQAFRPEQLFMDIDNIEPGLDFVKVLEEQVAECDALISVIGKGWLDARDEVGARRLDNPNDFVRIEIESALKQGKRVIPVLVGEARIPPANELPEAMKPLAHRQAVRLTHERFRSDAQGLINVLQRALETAEASRKAQAEAERQSQQEEQRKREEEANARRTAEEEQRRAEKDERRRLRLSQARLFWPPSRPVFAAGSLIGLTVLGVLGVSLFMAPPAPVAPPTPTPIAVEQTPTPTPQPVPVAPTQLPDTPLPPYGERGLKPKDTFKECSNCPEMVVVSSGSFTMGSPASEAGRDADEGPQHRVTFARQFAVGQFELTFDEWDACAADGGCNGYKPADQGWGRARQPVINVSWNDAKGYVAWLSKKTGRDYRLLTEAEYEYATRAGTQTAYPWGNDIGKGNANCRACGSQWDAKQTAPVGSFPPNGFGLSDMVGNVWAWTEDCYHNKYNGAPADGSVWTTADCMRVVRGGSWFNNPLDLRSAIRFRDTPGNRLDNLGFRVGRTLLPP